jgi:NTE family protein
LALGGGFARGMAHIGVLRALERHRVPVDFIAGVSAGAVVAAAYASGTTPGEIEAIARSMRFKDVARWTINRLGLAQSDRMAVFLRRLLKVLRFENMRIPLVVVASDLGTGKPVIFRDSGDVVTAVRASCAYPGLFTPVRYAGRYLVDGMVSMEVPASPLRQMSATRVLSVALPSPEVLDPTSMFSVVNRCFQILTRRTEREWRRCSNLVVSPEVAGVAWDSFGCCGQLIQAGEAAVDAAMPEIEKWLTPSSTAALDPGAATVPVTA